MESTKVYSFIRYLEAKKTVDDRSLNHQVIETLSSNLPASRQDSPLHVLEIGSGIGTMLERLLERELLIYATYTAIDFQATNTAYMKQRLPKWAAQREFMLPTIADHGLTLIKPGKHIQVELETIDLLDFIVREKANRKWDLIIAHAFLDLVNVPTLLPAMIELLDTKGMLYLTLNFDAATILEPPIQPEFDTQVEALYHQSMDRRMINGLSSGDSRTGRRLFHQLSLANANILEAGGSDWVVYAQDGRYRADEAYFLHYIIYTIHQELKGHPDLDPERFEAWIATRHTQIERGELVFITHQLDILSRRDM